MRTLLTTLTSATFALFIASGVFAQDNSADLFADTGADTTVSTAEPDALQSSDTASTFSLKLSGDHQFKYAAPVYNNGNRDYLGDIKKPSFNNDLGIEVKDGNVKLVSHFGFNLSPLSSLSDGQNPNANWTKNLSIKPYENYVSWSPDKFKLSAGYQIFSWGVADRKNPTDNLNPRDYTVGVNPDKMPVLAADAVWYPTDNISIEGVAIPSKQASQYPEDFAEILGAKTFSRVSAFTLMNLATKAGIPTMANYNVNPTYDLKGSSPQDYVAGGKLNFNSAGLDLSLDYLYDLDSYYTPVITTEAKSYTVTGDASLGAPYAGAVLGVKDFYTVKSISLERKHVYRFGGDAKTTLGKFGLWFEGAYNLTQNSGSDDYSVRKSKMEYTLGSDVNFGPNDTGYINVQYFGSWIPAYDSSFYSDYANGQPDSAKVGDQAYMQNFYERAMVNTIGRDTEGLLQGATCNIKYEIADALFTPQITAVFAKPYQYDDTNENRYGSVVLNPELDIKPVDSFHILIGSDLYYSWHKVAGEDKITLDTKTDSIGTYTPSNNVYLKVVYKWNADVKK